MTTQDKIQFATTQPNAAYLKFITTDKLNLTFGHIKSRINMTDKIYTTRSNEIATSTALVNMILNNKF